MSTERNKALSRIRASFAAYRDVEASSGTFQVDDMKHLLDVLEEREQLLSCLKADLKEIQDNAEQSQGRGVEDFGMMARSSLTFLKGYGI